MKILFLSFYFEPDLCAGSFRNTSLAYELGEKLKNKAEIHVLTTMPNRYNNYKVKAEELEIKDNIIIKRFHIPSHNSGFKDQIFSFKTYFSEVLKATKGHEYDLIYASSSRLFTAFLGAYLARKKRAVLFLDIRDIFKETVEDIINNKLFKAFSEAFIILIEKYTFKKAKAINLVSEGFKAYFKKRAPDSIYSFFPNGIDDIFLKQNLKSDLKINKNIIITYAGNIGSGQGLEKTLPLAAQELGGKYLFRIIGAGGTLNALKNEINKLNISNILLIEPVNRETLVKYYNESDILFLQLNDLPAFKKVLPSKIFEYGASVKPIVAGISGYSAKFLTENVSGSFLFYPGDWKNLVKILKQIKLKEYKRIEFSEKYSRKIINQNLADHIISFI